MEFLEKENDKLCKYRLVYNKDELEKVRDEIVYNCGIREHESFEHDSRYIAKDSKYIENYKETTVKTTKFLDDIRNIVLVEYDVISIPLLASLINRLITDEDVEIVDYLYKGKKLNNELEEYKEYIEKKKSKLEEHIFSYDLPLDRMNDISKASKELDDKVKKNEKLNLKDQNEYIDKVKQSIIISKVDEIDYDLYDKVTSFVKTLKIR